MIKDIFFSTAKGEYVLTNWKVEQTVKEVCIINRIPFQSLSIYLRNNDSYEIFVGLNTKISDIASLKEELVLKSDSNTNYLNVTGKNILVQQKKDSVSEYSFPSDSDFMTVNHIELTIDDCKSYVSKEIIDFIKTYTNTNSESKIVMGISGGGDSNVLIESFIESGIFVSGQLIPVMVRGIPGTDEGIGRAREICKNFGLELIEINQKQINELLGRTRNSNWISDFKEIFPNSDIEIIGTLAIRLALFDVAENIGADACVLGLNMEDMLSESFIRTMEGLLPLPFPIREIEKKKLWFPLFNIPKKILDGCYPKYSFQNYNERIPNAVAGRDIGLYIAQMIPTIISGGEFEFLKGYQKLSNQNKTPFVYDKQLGLTLLNEIDITTRNKWLKYLNN
jgi:hypothetical protein